MQARRSTMARRVVRRYGRVPGEHGDAAAPAFFPISINPGWWGQPFAKVKDGTSQLVFMFCIMFPIAFYWTFDVSLAQRTRVATIGKRALYSNSFFRQIDLDDPDHAIKYQKLQEERAENKLEVRWGGTNFLASYLWEPNDPQPDIRRKEPPVHH